MSKKQETENIAAFYSAVLTLETPDDCRKFFSDVCTPNELRSIAQRYAVASMLEKGETYLEIAGKTGASTATISRVNRSLVDGKGGYQIVWNRQGKEEG